WRLGLQYLDCQLVLDGPMGDYASQRERNIDGHAYLEDVLTASEQDLICGVYKVLNGKSDVSWWPKQSTWLSSGANVGYWSSSNEEWFQNRLSKIRQGLGKPLNAKEWRDALRYDKATRKLMVEVESMS
ncbi:hypothetical protein PHLGIDRAFT_55462, partial [Phlebiopsis gigantea 11061_1 CR5-6]